MSEWMPAGAWVRRDDVALAAFPDGCLAFQAGDCRLLDLNDIAAAVLTELSSPVGEQELLTLLARRGRGPESGVTTPADLAEVLAELQRLRLVKRRSDVVWRRKEPFSMDEATRYLANPDVSCRIEDEEGAILYNPDAESCQVVNAVGLELWQHLSEPRRRDDLVTHLCATYDGVTPEEATKDVDAFLLQLGMHGFIGEVQRGGVNGV